MVQRIFILFTELPGLMRLGVLILVIGGTLDQLTDSGIEKFTADWQSRQ